MIWLECLYRKTGDSCIYLLVGRLQKAKNVSNARHMIYRTRILKQIVGFWNLWHGRFVGKLCGSMIRRRRNVFLCRCLLDGFRLLLLRGFSNWFILLLFLGILHKGVLVGKLWVSFFLLLPFITSFSIFWSSAWKAKSDYWLLLQVFILSWSQHLGACLSTDIDS